MLWPIYNLKPKPKRRRNQKQIQKKKQQENLQLLTPTKKWFTQQKDNDIYSTEEAMSILMERWKKDMNSTQINTTEL